MRIISGIAGGRKLAAPAGEKTRPTSDKLRGSLFNILGLRTQEAWVLDVFGGTGALALDLPLFAPTHYAWGVTSIMLPAGVDGDKLLKVAADECGIIFAGGQDHYKGRMVRFGHMGWVDWADALAGLHALAHGLRASGGFSASRDYLETALSAYRRALDVEPGRVIPDVRS